MCQCIHWWKREVGIPDTWWWRGPRQSGPAILCERCKCYEWSTEIPCHQLTQWLPRLLQNTWGVYLSQVREQRDYTHCATQFPEFLKIQRMHTGHILLLYLCKAGGSIDNTISGFFHIPMPVGDTPEKWYHPFRWCNEKPCIFYVSVRKYLKEQGCLVTFMTGQSPCCALLRVTHL